MKALNLLIIFTFMLCSSHLMAQADNEPVPYTDGLTFDQFIRVAKSRVTTQFMGPFANPAAQVEIIENLQQEQEMFWSAADDFNSDTLGDYILNNRNSLEPTTTDILGRRPYTILLHDNHRRWALDSFMQTLAQKIPLNQEGYNQFTSIAQNYFNSVAPYQAVIQRLPSAIVDLRNQVQHMRAQCALELDFDDNEIRRMDLMIESINALVADKRRMDEIKGQTYASLRRLAHSDPSLAPADLQELDASVERVVDVNESAFQTLDYEGDSLFLSYEDVTEVYGSLKEDCGDDSNQELGQRDDSPAPTPSSFQEYFQATGENA